MENVKSLCKQFAEAMKENKNSVLSIYYSDGTETDAIDVVQLLMSETAITISAEDDFACSINLNKVALADYQIIEAEWVELYLKLTDGTEVILHTYN